MASDNKKTCYVKCSDCGNLVKVELGHAKQCPYCGQWVGSWQNSARIADNG